MAVLGASFLLLWACEAAQHDISQALSLAIVALLAVLPEYAVDMYFTWQAGQHPESNYAQYSVANMTGANRLLIGVAWSVIAVIAWWRTRREVRLEKVQRTEVLFLGLATCYGLVVPMKGTLAWYDAIVFLGIYVWYLVLSGKRPTEPPFTEGPALLLVRLERKHRRIGTALAFLCAGGVILINAQPFCEGLLATGRMYHINEFILVQWVAPVASEAPEFVVASMLAWRGRSGTALGTLLSAELNQWTLLVGMIPVVFAISHGGIVHPIPMGPFQMQEILLTASQSALAVVMLSALRYGIGNAIVLFALFAGQLVLPAVANSMASPGLSGFAKDQIHSLFTLIYLVTAAVVFLLAPGRVWKLREGARAPDAVSPQSR